MQIRKIAVIGAGTMGVQIALLIAGHGYAVRIHARHPERFWKTLQELRVSLPERMPAPAVDEWLKAAARVAIHADLREALEGADLVVEAIPENRDEKRRVFAAMAAGAPREAILSTTSSSIPIAEIARETDWAGRCVNLHFYQPPQLIRMVEVMAGPLTSAEVMATAEAFIRSLGSLPLVVKKEIPGFGFPSVLYAVYRQALQLWAGGVMDFQDIDRAWMIFTQTDRGPFGLMDGVGLDVVYDVLMQYVTASSRPEDRPPQALRAMIDRRELGRKTGKGFYTYPRPAYADPHFTKGVPANHDPAVT